MSEQKNNKKIRKIGNKIGWGILIYNIILFVIVFIDMFVRLLTKSIKQNTEDMSDEAFEVIFNEVMDEVLLSGTSSIIAVTIGVLFLILFFMKNLKFKQMWSVNKNMNKADFFKLLSVFMAGQLFFSLIAIGMEKGLNLIGYTSMEEMATATEVSSTVSMFLYAGIIGPIAEEIVYRGFVMNILKPYGKHFAIVCSAIIFGIMHANIHQIFFAILVGLVLGYVAMEYSLKWAVALHIFNNCILGDVFSYLTAGFSENVQEILVWVVQIIFFIIAAIVMYKQRKEAKEYFINNKEDKRKYRQLFLNVGMIAFMVIHFALAIDGITKLK